MYTTVISIPLYHCTIIYLNNALLGCLWFLMNSDIPCNLIVKSVSAFLITSLAYIIRRGITGYARFQSFAALTHIPQKAVLIYPPPAVQKSICFSEPLLTLGIY